MPFHLWLRSHASGACLGPQSSGGCVLPSPWGPACSWGAAIQSLYSCAVRGMREGSMFAKTRDHRSVTTEAPKLRLAAGPAANSDSAYCNNAEP
jgi:hypothetical protein